MRPIPALLAALVPALAVAQSQVDVRFGDLEKFTDLRSSTSDLDRERSELAQELRRHLERRAPAHLPPGARLAITITDVDMAGEFRPGGGAPYTMRREVRGVYPPRVDLEFRLLRPDGSVERDGKRELRNSGFLMSRYAYRNESLTHEKGLIDRWLMSEFAANR